MMNERFYSFFKETMNAAQNCQHEHWSLIGKWGKNSKNRCLNQMVLNQSNESRKLWRREGAIELQAIVPRMAINSVQSFNCSYSWSINTIQILKEFNKIHTSKKQICSVQYPWAAISSISCFVKWRIIRFRAVQC